MEKRELAEKFLEQLCNTEHLKADRAFTKVVQGDSFVLNYLYTHNCQAHPKEISLAMAVTSARIAKILRGLKSRELITRAIDRDDSRQVVIVLTSKGISEVERMRDEAISRIEACFSTLDEKDIRDFIRIKDKITSAMRD